MSQEVKLLTAVPWRRIPDVGVDDFPANESSVVRGEEHRISARRPWSLPMGSATRLTWRVAGNATSISSQ